MNSSLTARDLLDSLSRTLTRLLHNCIERWFGPNSDSTVFGTITRADFAVMLCYVVFALALTGAMALLLRRNVQWRSGVTDSTQKRRHLFDAISRPLYVLIWVYGVYFAATPLLLKLKPDEALEDIRDLFTGLFDLCVFVTLFWLLFRLTHVLEARLTHWASLTRSKIDGLFVPLLGRSLRVLVPVLGVIFTLPILNLPNDYAAVVGKGTSILLIAALAVILFQVVATGERALLGSFDITAADNLRARTVYTQVHGISKVIYVVIGFFAIATILMLFEEVRHVGTSLLASAGIVGIIAGVAAQKPLANLFAGFQIAMAQPMRQDDVVIVEGEWGRIEDITLTYVVVRIWDDRRMVLPLSYFIEKPFQNWTRTSAQLMGAILIWVDYTFPVDEARTVLRQIIESSTLWDKRFWNLQVSDTTERTMQLRVLATAADSAKAWDLRCEIREKLIAYIQQHHPQSLPRLRTQIARDDAAATGRSV